MATGIGSGGWGRGCQCNHVPLTTQERASYLSQRISGHHHKVSNTKTEAVLMLKQWDTKCRMLHGIQHTNPT
jgi:hypothetical protein